MRDRLRALAGVALGLAFGWLTSAAMEQERSLRAALAAWIWMGIG